MSNISFKLTIFSRANMRRGQWSTKGILERVAQFVPVEQITHEGLFVYVTCYDRPTLDDICKRINTYAGCRVPVHIDVIK